MCIKCVGETTLCAMQTKAEELGLHGACVVLTVDKDDAEHFEPQVRVAGNEFIDPPEATAGWSPTGANYFAIAMSKIAEMLGTGQASGTVEDHQPCKGEFGYKGGITWVHSYKGIVVYIAFSGGTEEEDLQKLRRLEER